MEILSIIPARANSKGIPGKNTKLINGKPLIVWSIESSLKSRHISRTVVSTDGENIKEISILAGAEVVDRPESLSGDEATSESALIHVLEQLKIKENYRPDLVVFLQCTSPLTLYEDIDNCIEKLWQEDADSATTATDFHYFIWKNTQNGSQGINHDKNVRQRRQDRKPQYLETGAVYVFKTDGFLENEHRFFGKTVLSYMPPERVKEIDDPVDLVIAEVMLKTISNNLSLDKLPDKIDAVFFDFDGVMTDNKVLVAEDGKESVFCSRGDGMGISMLKTYIPNIVVLSTEANPVVKARCSKLKIECHTNLGGKKAETLKKYLNTQNINAKNILFMGNDLNDSDCMQIAGCSVAPCDAHTDIIQIADLITSAKGGDGAVRELCDLIIKKITNHA